MKTIANQKGFGAIEVAIVLAVMGLLGFGGWYMFNRNKKAEPATNTENSYTQTAENTVEAKTETFSDEDAQKWTLATSAQKGFSIRIPDGWNVANYDGSDNLRSNQITYKTGQAGVVETIGYPYAGDSPIRFGVIQFNDGESFKYLDGDEQKTAFTAGSLSGYRYYKVYPVEEITGIGPLPGQESYTYEFKTSGKTTYVTYNIYNKNKYSEQYLQQNEGQTTSDTNQLELVDRVVKTLVIN